ncbi:hypothetical protein [Amycolatopsis sp. cg9]
MRNPTADRLVVIARGLYDSADEVGVPADQLMPVEPERHGDTVGKAK